MTKFETCPECEGDRELDTFSDIACTTTGTHWTSHRKVNCPTCKGEGEIEVEVDSVEPLLNDHPDFEQVFWWKPIAPPDYAAKGPFLDNSRALANRHRAGGQFEIIPRPDGSTRPSYSASDAAIMRRWPRVIAAIAQMNGLYIDESTIALREYLRGHNSLEMGFFGKGPSELVRGAIAAYFTSFKEGIREPFLREDMERSARYRRKQCQELTKAVLSKLGVPQNV